MAKVRNMSAQLEFAITAARGEIHRLLFLFPQLQAEFTSTNHADQEAATRKGETAAARARRLKYQKEYRERRKKEADKAGKSGQFSAAGRKKLSDAMKARWAAAKEAGTALNVKADKKAGKVINAAEAIQAQLKTETARDRKNRLQREWRAKQKKQKGVK